MGTKQISLILRELECPVCVNYMIPPIRLCTNGHSLCEPCRFKLTKCPICNGKFTEVRNRSLETVSIIVADQESSKEKYECKPVKSINIQNNYKSDDESCKWMKRNEEILQYWFSKQLTIPPYKEDNVCFMELIDGCDHINITIAYSQLFWFQQKTSEGKVYFRLQLIGNDDEVSRKYFYELQLGRGKKQLVLRNRCQSINYKEAHFMQMENALSLSIEDIKKYCTCNTKTHYRMQVHQV